MRFGGSRGDKSYGFEMNIDPSFPAEDFILGYAKKGMVYEPEVTEFFVRALRPGDFVVDVGANVGWFTLLAASLVGPAGSVLAFEPGSNNVPKIEVNVALNDFENVIVLDAPVTDDGRIVEFFLNADGSGGNSLWDPGKFPTNQKSREHPQSERMHSTTLDRHLVARPRLIKIDTEGAERRVLAGAVETLEGLRPDFIVAEMHEFGLAQMGDTQEEMRSFMRSFGYETFILFADGSVPFLVPRKTRIKSDWILNVLFSTQEAVADLWPVVTFGNPLSVQSRPLHGYRVVDGTE